MKPYPSTRVWHCLPGDRVAPIVKGCLKRLSPPQVPTESLMLWPVSLLSPQRSIPFPIQRLGCGRKSSPPRPAWTFLVTSPCLTLFRVPSFRQPTSKQKTLIHLGITQAFMSCTRNREETRCEHIPLTVNYTHRKWRPQIWQSSEVIWQWEPYFSQRSPGWWNCDGDSWWPILDLGNHNPMLLSVLGCYLVSLFQAIV